MVMRRLLVIVAVLVAAAVGAATPALAIGDTSGTGPGGGSAGGDQTQGSDSGSAFTTAGRCALYANSSSFGMACVGGGGGATPPTIQQLLGKGQKPPVCWDTYLKPVLAFVKYGVVQPPDAGYNTFLHTCLTGLNLDAPLAQQPGLNLRQTLIDIDKTKSRPCRPPNGDVTAPLPNEFAGVNMTCYLQVRNPQTKVTQFIASQPATIPSVTIVTHPAIDHVRTQVDTTFTDHVPCPGCSGLGTKTKVVDEGGGVRMWAQMDGLNDPEPFKILPRGHTDTDQWNGPDEQKCAGTAALTSPDRCHYTYRQSSSQQAGHYYPFRAVATWRVFYDDGTGPKQLALFHKYDDVRLPVSDVQTLVIPASNPSSGG
ncbi:hypothetical protein [uncultured Jatrophihabitans sp.]|uniref:hypothetical protein n=1 Tax=uncultured Jatrophihabitans sp. TaxID=1610747 RepID=UPI0035CBAD64